MTPTDHDICTTCGGETMSSAVSGLCPVCLLQQGAKHDTAGSWNFCVPASDDLEKLFPNLDGIEHIGSGGMGAVYRARQRGLDRTVALKILPPGIDGKPGFADRFTREARALAKLNHPGIVTIHDFGQIDGLYFLLMEYVQGMNLRQLLEHHPLTENEVFSIILPVCDALHYAHAAGVIHRDIKPENLLLDKDLKVKIADFGLAKLGDLAEPDATHDETAQSPLTQMGHLMGTPSYMAPEQIDTPSAVDQRADIYALGVVTYQMLTGKLPEHPYLPPSAIAKANPEWDAILARALQKNPDHRFPSIAELKEALLALAAQRTNPTETSMNLSFPCPHCQQKLSADRSAVGTGVTCPACQQDLIIPAETPPPIPAAPPPPVIHKPAPSPTPLATAAPKTGKAWAIWAMVLGIIGIIPAFGITTGTIALVLGIVGLVKKCQLKGMAIAGVVMGGISLLMTPLHVALINTSITAAKITAQSTVCASNLKQIGLALIRYKEDHQGHYPNNLDALVSEKYIAASVLHCPVHADGKSHQRYAYSSPKSGDAQGIIVWDMAPHSMQGVPMGRYCLYTNGSVQLLQETEFRSAPKALGSRPAPPPQITKNPQAPATPPPQRQRPPTAPQPEEKPLPMDVPSAAAALKDADATDRKAHLQLILDAAVDATTRRDVIAAIKPLINDVQHGDLAFRVFLKWSDNQDLTELIQVVETSPTSWRAKESMVVMSRSGDARVAPALVTALKEFHISREARAALIALGPVAKPELLTHFHHEDRRVRDTIREILKGYAATDQEYLAATGAALNSPIAETRRSAIEYLGKTPIAEEKRPGISRAVRVFLTDQDEQVRAAARTTMKTIVSEADGDYLLTLTTSTDDLTQKAATDLLIQIKDARVARPLAVLLSDPKETYRAGNQLILLGSVAEREVMLCLRSTDATTRRRAADVLAKIGTSASLSALQSAAKGSDFLARAAAESAISAIKGRERR